MNFHMIKESYRRDIVYHDFEQDEPTNGAEVCNFALKLAERNSVQGEHGYSPICVTTF